MLPWTGGSEWGPHLWGGHRSKAGVNLAPSDPNPLPLWANKGSFPPPQKVELTVLSS